MALQHRLDWASGDVVSVGGGCVVQRVVAEMETKSTKECTRRRCAAAAHTRTETGKKGRDTKDTPVADEDAEEGWMEQAAKAEVNTEGALVIIQTTSSRRGHSGSYARHPQPRNHPIYGNPPLPPIATNLVLIASPLYSAAAQYRRGRAFTVVQCDALGGY
ncbi:hypothetical protein B0H13DRAFT_1112419 [Mycena leptocephala]|nr:hypothetical protein B0H13DRAFT_1112419 [Mycena leptocephala]